MPATAHAKHHASTLVFPMKAAEYRKLMDTRIERVLAAVDKKLDRAGVSSDRKKAIHRTFDEVAKEARDAIKKAADDGTVTEDEAHKITPLITGRGGKPRERLQAEKSGKPSSPASDEKHKPKGKGDGAPDKTGKSSAKSKAKDAPKKAKDTPKSAKDDKDAPPE